MLFMFQIFRKNHPHETELGKQVALNEKAGLRLETELSPSKFFKSSKDVRTSKLSDRYREFFFEAKKWGLAEIEQLVPYINVPHATTEAERFSYETDAAASASALLEEFPPRTWGYYLPLSKELSTLGEKGTLGSSQTLSRRRSNYRLNFIWKGIEAVLGGCIRNKSVVDIACNWGGFSIEAHLRGASRVLGFDIREENIAKARRVAKHFNAETIEFQVQDLFTYEAEENFDIVLNLGLMYHISQPFEMMKKTYQMTREIAVIDTIVHREAFSGFILGTGEAAVDHAASAIGVELHPTYRALIDLAYMVGFKTVIELRGLPDPEWKDFEKDPYANRTRRCIVALK
jgi:hypothetical protein